MKDNTSKCCTCGYEWLTGTDGSHSCSSVMVKTIETLKDKAHKLDVTYFEINNIMNEGNKARCELRVEVERLKNLIRNINPLVSETIYQAINSVEPK